MSRAGWTLHEMLISLAVMGGVMAIAAHVAVGQLRFFRGIGEVVALRNQVGQASGVIASALWSVSPGAGDIVVALDSAIEIHASIGTAIVCGSAMGRITIPSPSPTPGNTLSSFAEWPEPGDRALALFADSLGVTWLTLHVGSAPAIGGACPGFQDISAARTLELREPLVVPVGAPVRFTRPMRLSLYHASDNRWYLGAKDWNDSTRRFNTIQPVAGPLAPYHVDRRHSGLSLEYRDANGLSLEYPFDPARIASVSVTARGGSLRPVRVSGLAVSGDWRYRDSAVAVVGLRNGR